MIYTFSKEFGDGYRSLTTHLRKMETMIKQIFTSQNQFDTNPVDTQRRFNIGTTSCRG